MRFKIVIADKEKILFSLNILKIQLMKDGFRKSRILEQKVLVRNAKIKFQLDFTNINKIVNGKIKTVFRVSIQIFRHIKVRAASRCPRRGIPVMFSKMFHKHTEKDFEICR